MYGARLSEGLVADIDTWAKANDVSRSEAIRRLVEIGLKAKVSAEFFAALRRTIDDSEGPGSE
jgi:hypothetical protein